MSRIVSKSPFSAPQFRKNGLLQRHAPGLYSFWKFARPHTIIGTSLSVLGLYLIARAGRGEWSIEEAVASLVPPLLACLCGNVYIVGLNQLEDVGIDRINKPHLPLASGEFSHPQGVVIVAIAGVLAFLLALWQGLFLLITVGTSLLIGTAYSLPPFRLKRFPVWASLCIFTVRGVIVNLGLFLHFQGRLAIPPSVWALTLFVLVFTFAIAIFKDIPDMEGDRRFNINTFTLRLGQRTIFHLALWVITICYLGMILAGLAGLPGTNRLFLVVFHLVALGLLWLRSMRVDLTTQASISRYYQFIWKLFFLEYLMFPIACLLS
ncbi:homogentisate phytyltransferase [Stenomitos frigidus]|uniref:Homogentisate phytyltransferase n=1 Tax=Stenomitos frigidus ULC18 TaxID=2107698 RepID=A0A2T1E9W1_9CYAN|nr:homogentisate phytyltransferase [Stenomitos frigidus]PSB29542.1 homogentisate phytyltransferase [Stenomitos frigidus ULC18]